MGTPKKWNSQNRRQENDIFGFGSDVFVMSDHRKHDTEKPIKKQWNLSIFVITKSKMNATSAHSKSPEPWGQLAKKLQKSCIILGAAASPRKSDDSENVVIP